MGPGLAPASAPAQSAAFLTDIKTAVESLDKYHQIEVLRILKKDKKLTLNENKSGIYINMWFVSAPILDEIRAYIDYVSVQNQQLEKTETECAQYKKILSDKDITSGAVMAAEVI